MYYREEEMEGFNPKTNEKTTYTRHTLYLEEELPIGEQYSELIKSILEDNTYASKQKCSY